MADNSYVGRRPDPRPAFDLEPREFYISPEMVTWRGNRELMDLAPPGDVIEALAWGEGGPSEARAATQDELDRFSTAYSRFPDVDDRLLQNLVSPYDYEELRRGNLGDWIVKDPEGVTGSPLFFAGSTEDENIPLSDDDAKRLFQLLTNVTGPDDPELGPYWSWAYGAVKPKVSARPRSFLDEELSDAGAEGGSGGTAAHEGAHAISHALNAFGGYTSADGRPEIPGESLDPHISGIALEHRDPVGEESPLAAAGLTDPDRAAFVRDANKDAFDKYPNIKSHYEYLMSPQELFAESLRAYVQDPEGFKKKFPDVAKQMRQLINNSWMKDYLMLGSVERDADTAVG